MLFDRSHSETAERLGFLQMLMRLLGVDIISDRMAGRILESYTGGYRNDIWKQNRMEQRLDNFIDSFFGGMGSGLMVFNGVLGLALIVAGVILMRKKASSKNKNTAGIVCVGIGILAIISVFLQTMLR